MSITLPTELTVPSALAIVIVLVAVGVIVYLLVDRFARLSPARRRDVIRLVQALRGGPADDAPES